jgi:predicted ATP-grasp superfamily ATP-dependent carboligase
MLTQKKINQRENQRKSKEIKQIMTVFVTDGAERTSLAIARSLGKKGIEVHCGESYRFSTTALSKYCTKNFVYPDPQIDCKQFINRLVDIFKNGDYEAIYSSREVTTIPISYYKKELEKYTKVPFPDYDKMLMTHDKAKTFKFAQELGISIPETYLVENMEELEEISNTIEYPVVVKPRCKTTWNSGKPMMLKVTSKNYVNNRNYLINLSNDIYKKSWKMPLIQEYIHGDGYGVEVLFNHGEPRAVFMHKRLREYPITGGASTLRESIYNERMKNVALDLMEGLEWHGVAMVEFKLDTKDGEPKLMEVNGRFWGSLPLSIASGVDFPYLLHKMATEGDVEPVFEYKTGVKCRWLIPGDMLWFVASLKNRVDKWNVFRAFFKFSGMDYDMLSREDFMPTIGALRVMMHQMMEVVSGKRNISGEVGK